MSGPFDTETEVRALPEVRAIYDAMHASTRRGVADEGNHRLLCEALTAAGVELGGYDHRIAAWLAGWEPQTVAVIAGWIRRAHQPSPAQASVTLDGDLLPTVMQALADAATDSLDRAGRDCQACADHPAGLCENHAADLDAAERYRQAEQDLAKLAGEVQR